MNKEPKQNKLPVRVQTQTGNLTYENISAIISSYVQSKTAIKLESLEHKFSVALVNDAIKIGKIKTVQTSLGKLALGHTTPTAKGETIVRKIIKTLLEDQLISNGGTITKKNNTTTHGTLNNQPVWISAHPMKNLEQARIAKTNHVKANRRAIRWMVVLERTNQRDKVPKNTRCFLLRSTPGGYHDLEAL